MNTTIDCLFIGFYKVENKKQRQLFMVNNEDNASFNASLHKFDMEHVYYKDNWYSAKQLFNLFYSNCENKHNPTIVEEVFSFPIAFLGTDLIKNGFTIDYINCFNIEEEMLEQQLKTQTIETIVIPTTFYTSFYPLLKITNFIRKHNKTAKIIIGGPYIANQIRTLQEKEIQKLFHIINADIYVYNNEGEETLKKILIALKNNSSLNKIENIFYKSSANYLFTFYKKENVDINMTIPNWLLFKEDLSSNVSMRTAISCPFSCSFCNYPITAGKYHQISLEKIEYELNILKSTGKVYGLYFIDDTLNFPPERFKAILRMMIKNKYHFKWNAHFRCQYIDIEMLELMKGAGCIQVYLGIESGNQQILDNMNKRVTVDKYYKGIELLNKYEILSTASVIVGFPGETYHTFMDTFNLIEQAKPTFFRVHLWHYNTSAPINKNKDLYSLRGEHYNWEHSTMDSKTAHELTKQLFFNIKNSIFETDFPLPYDLITKGYELGKIIDYMKCFNEAVKNKLKSNCQIEISNDFITNLKTVLTD